MLAHQNSKALQCWIPKITKTVIQYTNYPAQNEGRIGLRYSARREIHLYSRNQAESPRLREATEEPDIQRKVTPRLPSQNMVSNDNNDKNIGKNIHYCHDYLQGMSEKLQFSFASQPVDHL